MHKRIHTGIRAYECQICQKAFFRKDILAEHVRAHDPNDASYVCAVCGMTFPRRHSLHVHMRHHEPHTKLSCAVCQKTYLTRQNLKRHEETHQEKKQCPKCNVFVVHLKSHIKVCGVQGSFICTLCGKVFYQKRYLAQHLSTHGLSKQHECSDCGEIYKHRASLLYHKKKCHTLK